MDREKSYFASAPLPAHDIVAILLISYKTFAFLHSITKGMYPWKGKSKMSIYNEA